MTAEESKNTEDKRVCYACGGRPHVDKRSDTGRLRWYYNMGTDFVLCNGCYNRIINRDYYLKHNKSKIRFKQRRIWLGTDTDAYTDVCNWCRAVVDQINAQFDVLCTNTERHHEQYDENNPLAHSIEICNRCHGKHTGKLIAADPEIAKKRMANQIIIRDPKTGRFISNKNR